MINAVTYLFLTQWTHTLNVESPGVRIECVGHVIVHSQGRAPTSGSLSMKERERAREQQLTHIPLTITTAHKLTHSKNTQSLGHLVENQRCE